MTDYGQFCPVSKASEVVCRPWTPLIVRELLVGSSRFNEIRRGIPTCSPALLSKRLKELTLAGVITHEGPDGAYRLTDAGRELFPLIQSLGEWGQRWVRSDYGPDDLDPGLLLWDVRRYVDPKGLGNGRTVVQFSFPSMAPARRYYWMVLDGNEADLCLTEPGDEVDVEVTGDLGALTKVWMGDSTFRAALSEGSLMLHGRRTVTSRIPAWFGQHPVLAGIPKAG
ncbi:MAG TPA: helix-turn-helix domain-containing protein [Acidimicrobiales bacterium]|jgi:DNA-binding HxlR family transcriptional regulator